MRAASPAKIRALLRWGWIYFLHFTGLLKWVQHRIAAQGGAIVLTLHRVLEPSQQIESCSPPGMIVLRSTYESLMRHIALHCHPVRLSDPFGGDAATHGPRMAVTFDDGWIDTGRVAFPIARQLEIETTVFVCPGLVGRESPFWPERVVGFWRLAEASPDMRKKCAQLLSRLQASPSAGSGGEAGLTLESLLRALKEMPVPRRDEALGGLMAIAGDISSRDAAVDATMDWAEIETAALAGLQIGSHTQSHAILTTVPDASVRSELFESRLAIEQALARKCDLFAYPNGNWSPVARQLAAAAGYRLAFVNQCGIWNQHTDSHLIPRVNVWEGMLIGPSGRFSSVAFEYAVFWRSYRAKPLKIGEALPTS